MKKLRILFAFHKSVENYKSQLDDEIEIAQKWFEDLGVNTEISKRDFENQLHYQSYNNGAFKALSIDCQKAIAGQITIPGEFHIIYLVFKPEEQGSAGVFSTFGWYKANGSIIICLPLTEADAKREDKWMWRAIVHEGIHAFFGLLNLNAGIKILDVQDALYQSYRAQNPNATEDEMTNLSKSIFIAFIKPHLEKLYTEPQEMVQSVLKPLSSALETLASSLYSLLNILSKRKKSVIERLAECIAQFEGFYIEGTIANKNNNPGLLVWSPFQSGQRNGFAYFNNRETGWEALYYQLELIFKGKSKYYKPSMTIQEFVNVWASTSPIIERINYAKYIANHFGVDASVKLNELR